VTLLGHVRPDADALGSALALGIALHERGARVRVSFGEPAETPDSLRYLDSAGLLVAQEEIDTKKFDAGKFAPDGVLVALDSSSASRLGTFSSIVDSFVAAGGTVLVVDHHVNNTRFGSHHLIDESAEATAVLVLRLLDAMRAPLSAPIADCLYAGLATDTSWFRRARPATHEMAARLLAAGADPDRAARELSDGHPFAWLTMLSTVLGRAQLDTDAARGRGLVLASVHLADAGYVRLEEVESVIDVVRGTAEADVAAVLKELAPRRWSISLRSSTVDVRAVAEKLGGGGHRLAAGCTTDGTEAEVVRALRAALAEVVG
jgi:phosphoesterase RecJ-like protein